MEDKEKQLQEQQYEYPYHYLPRVEDGRFTQTRYWSWGMHYLGGMHVVKDLLDDITFASLIDVGCGDGRLLSELSLSYPDATLRGVDYSERSISMANGLNPHLNYETIDITEEDLENEFEVATAVEVLEHIQPEKCSQFIKSISEILTNDGYLIITVPHKNKPVSNKHYQHFDSEQLEELLNPYFSKIAFVPFDRQSKIFTALELALGGRGNHFIINTPLVTNTLWRIYKNRYLYAPTESSCRRIAAVCHL
jgi:2-polyprenyl-3-methyl-5-hydroxy-6-metoxy-1,4-benzoquinol methylase